jgi:hypothetical protein
MAKVNRNQLNAVITSNEPGSTRMNCFTSLGKEQWLTTVLVKTEKYGLHNGRRNIQIAIDSSSNL